MDYCFNVCYSTICKGYWFTEKYTIIFEVGTISYSKDKNKKLATYRVRSLNELSVIINFFKSFPLITSKRHNFNLFVVLYEILCKKEHLSLSGFLKSISIINNINISSASY